MSARTKMLDVYGYSFLAISMLTLVFGQSFRESMFFMLISIVLLLYKSYLFFRDDLLHPVPLYLRFLLHSMFVIVLTFCHVYMIVLGLVNGFSFESPLFQLVSTIIHLSVLTLSLFTHGIYEYASGVRSRNLRRDYPHQLDLKSSQTRPAELPHSQSIGVQYFVLTFASWIISLAFSYSLGFSIRTQMPLLHIALMAAMILILIRISLWLRNQYARVQYANGCTSVSKVGNNHS